MLKKKNRFGQSVAKNNDGAFFTENSMLHLNINYHGYGVLEAKIKDKYLN